MILLRAQYAHPKAFKMTSPVHDAQVVGHSPYSIEKIFARHPATAMSCEELISVVCPRLQPVADAFGGLTEEDLDKESVEETKEQRAARDKGHLVKDKSNAPSKWRFVWLNHSEVIAKRAGIKKKLEEKQVDRQERKEAKEAKETQHALFPKGPGQN